MTNREDPDRLLGQASRHASAGRLVEAMADYARALDLSPERPNSWYNLARLQRRAGLFDAALASYRQALRHGVTQPEEVHLNCGVIHADDLRQDDEAERELDAALALNPVYVPALLNLANLHEDRGRRAAALSTYERLLALDATCHEALARYASLRGVADPADPLADRLRAAITSAETPLADKASLGFALGKVLDGCCDYDAAFRAYRQANLHSRASAVSAGPPYDQQRHARYVDELIHAFPGPGRAGETVPGGAAPPIFICGMFRSGSTLAEQVLAGHPMVRAGGEIGFLPQLVRGRLAPYPSRVATLSTTERNDIAQAYRAHLARLAQGAPRITDKRPDNFLHVGLIKTLFPDARIIHTTRNPLDNALSIYFLHLDASMGYATDLSDIAHYHGQYRRLMAHWKSVHGADILDFDYDTLVRDPRPAIQRLLDYCGLPWDDGCMAFHRVDNSVRTASVWQVRQPLYAHASGRWRHYAAHLDELRDLLGEV
ncbi:MAG: tetratricopeptide repeat-containing sulfotransferase family protein [Aquabacterium sp.]